MSEFETATKLVESINSRLDLATPLVKSAEMFAEMAKQFAELGDFEMATALMECSGIAMESAQKILGGK